jgi:hypothetical protein
MLKKFGFLVPVFVCSPQSFAGFDCLVGEGEGEEGVRGVRRVRRVRARCEGEGEGEVEGEGEGERVRG